MMKVSFYTTDASLQRCQDIWTGNSLLNVLRCIMVRSESEKRRSSCRTSTYIRTDWGKVFGTPSCRCVCPATIYLLPLCYFHTTVKLSSLSTFNNIKSLPAWWKVAVVDLKKVRYSMKHSVMSRTEWERIADLVYTKQNSCRYFPFLFFAVL